LYEACRAKKDGNKLVVDLLSPRVRLRRFGATIEQIRRDHRASSASSPGGPRGRRGPHSLAPASDVLAIGDDDHVGGDAERIGGVDKGGSACPVCS
jgi:hypothetical protein